MKVQSSSLVLVIEVSRRPRPLEAATLDKGAAAAAAAAMVLQLTEEGQTSQEDGKETVAAEGNETRWCF